jgi:capsular exopolysaccharide synthesis family protein
MPVAQERDTSLSDLLSVLSRRRRTIYIVLIVVFLLAALVCVFSTRRYRASSTIQLQKTTADALNLEGMLSGSSGGMSDALSVNVDLQTQSNILQSETLAIKVIKDLNLEQNSDFQSKVSFLGRLLERRSEAKPQSFEDSPRRRQALRRVFDKNLSVRVVPGTRLIQVAYSNPDAAVASQVVNHLVQGLIDYTFQTKFAATNEVSSWLEAQLDDLRKQNEKLQTRVVELQKESGLFGISPTSDQQSRGPVVFSPALSRLEHSTAALVEAKMNTILKGSVYEAVRTGNAELISQLSGTTLSTGVSQGVASGLTVIQTLRSQEATLQAQIAQDAAKLGPANPKLMEERAALRQLQASLQAEINRTAERAKSDYEIARRAEIGAKAINDADRVEAGQLNDKAIEYAIVEREATQSQALYQDLLRRLKEAGIIEGLRASNVTVVDPGRVPARPSSPRVFLLLALGLGGGFFLGCIGAFLVDAIDNVIRGPQEIETMQLPLLGMLPMFSPAAGANPSDTDEAYREALIALRSTLLISRSNTPPKVILVASSGAAEGKSTTAANLAIVMANFGKKVLLLEADLRRPVLHRRFSLKATRGLSQLLSDRTAQFEAVKVSLPKEPELYALAAGPVPPYPAELLGSKRMEEFIAEWRGQFDFIVIDSPPVLPVADARIVSAYADVILLLCRPDHTKRAALSRAYQTLVAHSQDPQSASIGIVVNAISPKSPSYYGYYGYYRYNYSHYSKYYGGKDAGGN